MKRVMVVLEIEGSEAVIVESKELIQSKEKCLESLRDNDDCEVIGKFTI
tara:strand:+ start:597 stop:743 length:147 start_codon:yes stop_codon:yes gene_type:complete